MGNIQIAINIKTKVPPPAAASDPVTSCVDVTRLTAAVDAVLDPYLLHAVHVQQVDVPPRLCLQQRVRAAALTVGGRGVAVDGAGGHFSFIEGRLEGRLVAGDVRHDCNVHHMGPLNQRVVAP